MKTMKIRKNRNGRFQESVLEHGQSVVDLPGWRPRSSDSGRYDQEKLQKLVLT